MIIFRVLPHALAADVFEYLDFDAQQILLRAMAHEQVVAVLNEMAPDDRTALLEELPSAAARQLIRLLTPEERCVATALLGYPEESVGRLMTPDFIAVREDWTVQQVLDYIRQHGQDSETLNVIYVVDDRGTSAAGVPRRKSIHQGAVIMRKGRGGCFQHKREVQQPRELVEDRLQSPDKVIVAGGHRQS